MLQKGDTWKPKHLCLHQQMKVLIKTLQNSNWIGLEVRLFCQLLVPRLKINFETHVLSKMDEKLLRKNGNFNNFNCRQDNWAKKIVHKLQRATELTMRWDILVKFKSEVLMLLIRWTMRKKWQDWLCVASLLDYLIIIWPNHWDDCVSPL